MKKAIRILAIVAMLATMAMPALTLATAEQPTCDDGYHYEGRWVEGYSEQGECLEEKDKCTDWEKVWECGTDNVIFDITKQDCEVNHHGDWNKQHGCCAGNYVEPECTGTYQEEICEMVCPEGYEEYGNPDNCRKCDDWGWGCLGWCGHKCCGGWGWHCNDWTYKNKVQNCHTEEKDCNSFGCKAENDCEQYQGCQWQEGYWEAGNWSSHRGECLNSERDCTKYNYIEHQGYWDGQCVSDNPEHQESMGGGGPSIEQLRPQFGSPIYQNGRTISFLSSKTGIGKVLLNTESIPFPVIKGQPVFTWLPLVKIATSEASDTYGYKFGWQDETPRTYHVIEIPDSVPSGGYYIRVMFEGEYEGLPGDLGGKGSKFDPVVSYEVYIEI